MTMVAEIRKFRLFYFIRYFGDAFFYPFLTIYLIKNGLQEGQIGILMAILPFVAIFVNPFWNMFVKDMRTSRIVLQIMTFLEGMLVILLTSVSGFGLYALIILMIAVLCSPFISLQDGFTATFANNSKIEYSSIRIFASIAYVIALVFSGMLLSVWGFDVLFMIAGIMFVMTFLIAVWIHPIEKRPAAKLKTNRDFQALFKNIDFYKFLVFYTLVIGAVRVGDTFFGVFLIKQMKAADETYGFVYAAFVFVEVLTILFLIKRRDVIKERVMMIAAVALFIIRFMVYALNPPLWAVIAVTMFRGFSWGVILHFSVRYMIKIVKIENVTPALMIATMLYSLFIGSGTLIFGGFIEANGYFVFYFVQAMIVTGGFLFFVFFPPFGRYKRQKGTYDHLKA